MRDVTPKHIAYISCIASYVSYISDTRREVHIWDLDLKQEVSLEDELIREGRTAPTSHIFRITQFCRALLNFQSEWDAIRVYT